MATGCERRHEVAEVQQQQEKEGLLEIHQQIEDLKRTVDRLVREKDEAIAKE